MSETNGTPNKDLPIIYMTQPSYGGGVRKSHRQFDGDASKRVGKDFLTMRGMTGGSLLAQSFNGAWCEALNLREAGHNIRWFAMLHDDIVPADEWLDILWEDLQASGADLMAAVVPIKDFDGNTSTALSAVNGDRFSVERRIHMAEVQRLPQVFGAADCNRPDQFLLANTGCWICRFDRPWVDAEDEHGNKIAFFTINDKICRNPNSGKWMCPVEPEDWFFSRQIQSFGAKVMCTNRLRLHHYGMFPFPNDGEWGPEDFDRAHGDRINYTMIGAEKVLPNMSYDSQELPDVAGWLNDDEGRLLAEMAAGKRVLEIGSYCGRSTIWMARTAQNVLAVDTFDGRGTPCPKDTRKEFLANVNRHGVGEKVDLCPSTTDKMLDNIRMNADAVQEFDFAFIDGAHDLPSVTFDIEQVMQVLIPGGQIAFHDYERPSDSGVKTAVDKLISSGATVVNRAGSVIVLQVQNGGTEEGRDEGIATTDSPGSAADLARDDQGGSNGSSDSGQGSVSLVCSPFVSLGTPGEP